MPDRDSKRVIPVSSLAVENADSEVSTVRNRVVFSGTERTGRVLPGSAFCMFLFTLFQALGANIRFQIISIISILVYTFT